jgi:hypothetical protein
VYILPIIAGILVLSYLICTVVPPPHKHKYTIHVFPRFCTKLTVFADEVYLFLNRYVQNCTYVSKYIWTQYGDGTFANFTSFICTYRFTSNT